MKVLLYLTALCFLSIQQNSLASRITFQATPSKIYPVVTKNLKLRCEIERDANTESANRPTLSKRELQSAFFASKARISRDLLRRDHQRAILTVSLSSITRVETHQSTAFQENWTTAHMPHVSHSPAASTVGNVLYPPATVNLDDEYLTNVTEIIEPSISTTTHRPPTTGHVDTTHGNVSHIVSIIISKQDKTDGSFQTVAVLSPFDPPTASIDLENIKVEGNIESSNGSNPLAQGYLDVSWDYPSEPQSGDYICDVYALDSTSHPVALSSSLRVTASETTLSQLTYLTAQNGKEINELRQELSQVITQLSILTQENQKQFEDFQNTTNTLLLNKTSNIKAQNIQTGNTGCSNTYVTFPKPYSTTPIVYISASDLQFTYSNIGYRLTVTIQNVTTTGFTSQCNSSAVTSSNFRWIAIDN